MNTPQSMAIGWGALLVAGAGSFYFARKEIDARRKMQREQGVRPTEHKQWYERLDDPEPPNHTPIQVPKSAVPPNTIPVHEATDYPKVK